VAETRASRGSPISKKKPPRSKREWGETPSPSRSAVASTIEEGGEKISRPKVDLSSREKSVLRKKMRGKISWPRPHSEGLTSHLYGEREGTKRMSFHQEGNYINEENNKINLQKKEASGTARERRPGSEPVEVNKCTHQRKRIYKKKQKRGRIADIIQTRRGKKHRNGVDKHHQ